MINRALAADLPPDAAWDVTLHLPPWVPPSEVAQVEARLAGWVASLRRPALQPLLEQLRQAMRAPLRPFWVCPESGSSYTPPEAPASSPAAAYLSVVTLCASRVWDAEREREQHSWHYVQGAGDDEENWSRGLRAAQWWGWREHLMAMAAQQPGAAAEELERLCTATQGRSEGDGGGDAAGGGGGGGGDAAEAHGGSGGATTSLRGVTALWGTGLLLGSAEAASHVSGGGEGGGESGGEGGGESSGEGSGEGAGQVAREGSVAWLNVGSPSLAHSRTPHGVPTPAAEPTATIPTSTATTPVPTASMATGAASAPEVAEAAEAASGAGASKAAGAAGPPPLYLHLPLDDTVASKHGVWQQKQHQWQKVVLPAALRFIAHHLAHGRRVVVYCDRGDDRAPAVALAALLALYDARAGWKPPPPPKALPTTSASASRYASVPAAMAAAAAAEAAAVGSQDGTRTADVTRTPLAKDEVRARLAILQGIYPAAQVQRSVIKELFNFFVAPVGGWQYLDLGADLNRRPAALDTEAVSTRAFSPQHTLLPGGDSARSIESVESVRAELATSSVADATDTAAEEAGVEAGEAGVWAAFVAAEPSWRPRDGIPGGAAARIRLAARLEKLAAPLVAPLAAEVVQAGPERAAAGGALCAKQRVMQVVLAGCLRHAALLPTKKERLAAARQARL